MNQDFPIPLEQMNKMISRFLMVSPFLHEERGVKNFMKYSNDTQVFHPIYSMFYIVNLDLCDYVPFSQIRSQMFCTFLLDIS